LTQQRTLCACGMTIDVLQGTLLIVSANSLPGVGACHRRCQYLLYGK
jgi:hypothetical protein